MIQNFHFHLVTLSGPQGCGKSTTLKALEELIKERQLPIAIDGFKASRAAQERIGIEDLRDAVSSYEPMLNFQRAILNTRIQHEEQTLVYMPKTIKVVICERAFADIAAYFRLWAGKLDTVNDHPLATEMFIDDARSQYKYISHHLYLPFMDHVKFEYDPNRGFEEDIQQFNDLLLDELAHEEIGDRKSTIEGITPLERAESILKQLEHLL